MGKKQIIRNYYEFYANELDNLEQMNKFPEIFNLPSLNYEERKNLNRYTTSKDSE